MFTTQTPATPPPIQLYTAPLCGHCRFCFATTDSGTRSWPQWKAVKCVSLVAYCTYSHWSQFLSFRSFMNLFVTRSQLAHCFRIHLSNVRLKTEINELARKTDRTWHRMNVPTFVHSLSRRMLANNFVKSENPLIFTSFLCLKECPLIMLRILCLIENRCPFT